MIHTYPTYKQRVGLLECGFSFTTGESLRVTCSEKRDRSSIFSDSIPNSQPPWMTQMSASRSSRWWGSFAKKLRKRPTRSPSLPKKYVPRFASSNFPILPFFSNPQFRSSLDSALRSFSVLILVFCVGMCRNSTLRSCSWLRLRRRRSGKSMRRKRSKSKSERRCKLTQTS